MPTKFSEKNLFAGIVLLAPGLLLLAKADLTNAPVRISEKGLITFIAAIIFLVLGVRSLFNTMHKV